jgi:hypothetical protein
MEIAAYAVADGFQRCGRTQEVPTITRACLAKIEVFIILGVQLGSDELQDAEVASYMVREDGNKDAVSICSGHRNWYQLTLCQEQRESHREALYTTS